ncbi:MAG: alpha/beta hydrolase, partial [Xanthobacteraceae bacterium]|nr:alpha/beta hydrolase [Xanthobacteraceae bacterium]
MAESRFTAANDGLELHALDYGDARSSRLPVVCLPGLSRTAEDFTPLATA